MHFNVCTASTRFLICQFPHFFSSPGKELLLQRGYLHFNACPFSSMSTDVDECQTNGTCPEHSTCANTFGSFVCTCNEGFMRNGSVCIGKMWLYYLGRHSLDRNTFCYLFTTVVDVVTFYSYLSTDMDECQINGTCPEHSTCSNTFGSFVCTCNEGFMKNGSVCIGKDFTFHPW